MIRGKETRMSDYNCFRYKTLLTNRWSNFSTSVHLAQLNVLSKVPPDVSSFTLALHEVKIS